MGWSFFRRGEAVPEVKASATGRVIAWGSSGRVAWSPRDVVSLTRTGFSGNPVGFRAVKLIAEAAAALPLICQDRDRRYDLHPLMALIQRLYRELDRKRLRRFRPICYLTDEWGCPSGEPVIGIPFYLADPQLASLEQAMNDVEELNRHTSQTVTELNHIAEVMESSVNQAVVSLQFQDMVTQLVSHVSKRQIRCPPLSGHGAPPSALPSSGC